MIPSSSLWINNKIRITYRDVSEGWMGVCVSHAFRSMAQKQMCHQKAYSSLGAISGDLHSWRCLQRKQAPPQAKECSLFPGVFCFVFLVYFGEALWIWQVPWTSWDLLVFYFLNLNKLTYRMGFYTTKICLLSLWKWSSIAKHFWNC